MIFYGRCKRKTVGFTFEKYYSFKKVDHIPPSPEDAYIEDFIVDYYVANDRGRLMAISQEYFDKYFDISDAEV